LRHCEQWQFSGAVSGPVISNSTPPHRQLPWMGDMPASVFLAMSAMVGGNTAICHAARGSAISGAVLEAVKKDG